MTLVEIMSVVGLIGMVIAIVAPRIDLGRYKADGGMQVVSTAMMAAQREAVSRQHDIVVMFDQANNSMIFLYDANNDGTVNGGERVRNLVLDRGVVFGRANATVLPAVGGSAVSFTRIVNGLPSLTYHRSGSASQAGGIYLMWARATSGSAIDADNVRALEVMRATGRPEWWSYDGSSWAREF